MGRNQQTQRMSSGLTRARTIGLPSATITDGVPNTLPLPLGQGIATVGELAESTVLDELPKVRGEVLADRLLVVANG